MKIGVIGTGIIGGTLAHKLSAARSTAAIVAAEESFALVRLEGARTAVSRQDLPRQIEGLQRFPARPNRARIIGADCVR